MKKIKWQDLYDFIDTNSDYDDEDLENLKNIKNSDYTSLKESNIWEYEKLLKSLQQASNNSSNQEIVSIRLTTHDIEKVKKMAQKRWVPYRNLISSIVHKELSQ